MKNFLIKLKVVLLFILFSASISLASEISPETGKLLDQLHAKTANIQSLSWDIQNKQSSYTTNGYYKQGGFIRLHTAFPYDDYPIDYLITFEKVLSYSARTGEITDGSGINVFSDAWFFLPLLDKNTLKNCGEIAVEKESIENKNYVVLEISYKTSPLIKTASNLKHRFYFDSEELKLEKIEHRYGNVSGQILKIKEYKKIGEYNFPVKIEGDYTNLLITNIQINPDLKEDLFKLEDKNALTYFSNYSEEEVKSEISKNPANPDLYYTLAKLLHHQKREIPAAIQEYKKTIILKPNARAAYFGLANAYSQDNKKEEAIQIYQKSIYKFPESINYIYQILVSLYQSEPSSNLDKALELAQEWLDKVPSSYSASIVLADLLQKKNRIEEACQIYEKLLENPNISANLKINYKTQLAKLYLKQEKGVEAEKILKDIIEQEDISSSHYYITQAQQELFKHYQKEGKLDKVKEEISAKIKETPDDTKLLKQLADIYKIEADYQKSIEIYEKIVSLEPDNQSLYQELANLYSQAGEKEKQVELYENLIKKFPSFKGRYLQNLMYAYQQAGKNEDAIKIAEELIKESPNQSHVYATTAQLYRNLKDYDKAIDMYRKAIELEQSADNQAQHLMQIGQIYVQQKKYEEAVQAYEEAKTKPKQEWIQQNANQQINELYRQMGKIDELINKYEAKLKEEPKNLELLKQLAEIYSQNRQYEKCIELYNKALAIKPDDRNILNQLASAYQNAKQYDKAIELFEELITKFPENKQNYLFSLMRAYQQAGRNEDAIKTAEEYIKENPSQAQSYATAASLYNNLKDYDKAIQMYRKAIELEENTDNQANYLMQIGQIYAQQKKYEEAEKAYEEAKTKSDQEWVQQNANSQINQLYQQMGKTDELTNKYEAKLKEEPKNLELLKQLAEIYSQNRQYEKCIELYKKALEIKPEDRNLLSKLASAYQNAKQYEKAITLYEELIAKFPENKQSYLSSLMYAYQQAGRNEDAIKTAEEYIKENPSQAHTYTTAANLYNNLKDYDKAIQFYRKAIEIEPTNINAMEQLAHTYQNAKKYDEAMEIIKKLIEKSPYNKQYYMNKLEQVSRERPIESSLIQKELDSLIVPQNNKIREEMNDRIAKAIAFRNENQFNLSSYIVIGHLVLDGLGNVQSDVKTQMDILTDGYFVALVGYTNRPLSFRMEGYRPLDVNLKAITGSFTNIGTLHLSPLSMEEKSSIAGKLVLEGNAEASNAKIYANFRQPYNTPHNWAGNSYGMYENSYYSHIPIQIEVASDGMFRHEKLSPLEYGLTISSPGYVKKGISLNLWPGKKLDLGTIILELPKKINIEYTGSGLDGRKEKITLVPDERWQLQLSGHWNLSFLQNEGKLRLTSFFGPWYATDLGEGTLDDFNGIENTEQTLLDQPSNFEIKDGYVYLVKSSEGKWLLFKAKID